MPHEPQRHRQSDILELSDSSGMKCEVPNNFMNYNHFSICMLHDFLVTFLILTTWKWQRRKIYRESLQQLRAAQMQQSQSTGTYRKHGRKSGQIPPPHQQAMQKQILKEQIKEQEARVGRERMKTPDQTIEKKPLDAVAAGLTAQQQLYAAKQMYEHQKQVAKQQLQQQKLYQQQLLLHQHQQQQQPHQQSIMKSTHKHHAAHAYTGHSHVHQHQQPQQMQQQQYFHSQYFPPVISPPEGFQSETPFDPVMDAEVELARRLHAKAAQVYATEPRHRHEGKEGKKKKHRHQTSSPLVLDANAAAVVGQIGQDEGYELCVASDAELHTIGQHPSAGSATTGTTNYFSLPRSHAHHRPASASPRNVQTLMKQPQSLYRRNDDYGYNYTA